MQDSNASSKWPTLLLVKLGIPKSKSLDYHDSAGGSAY